MPSNDASTDFNQSSSNESSVSDKFLFFSVFGVGVGSLIGAFGISLGLARRRNPDLSMKAIEGHESPSRLAARALGWGTLLAFTGVSGLAMIAGYVSGASNVSNVT